jgi:hypothetical protein
MIPPFPPPVYYDNSAPKGCQEKKKVEKGSEFILT